MSSERLAVIHGTVFAMADCLPGPARGATVDRLPCIPDGAVLAEDGTIVAVIPSRDLPSSFVSSATVVNAHGRAVLPGFVDPHTHLPFYGWRVDEYDERSRGQSYGDQVAAHGVTSAAVRRRGIARSVELLGQADDDRVLAFCRYRMAEAVRHGTVALELKTGYGASEEAELRQLRLARNLAVPATSDMPWPATKVTALFLHGRVDAAGAKSWPRVAGEVLLPRALAEGTVDAVDAFVDNVAFSVEEARPFFKAAKARGLDVHVHAEQLSPCGAGDLAVEVGALSADHGNFLAGDALHRLARSCVVAVLLPAADHTLRASPVPDAPALLAAGAAVALATDFNPGTSPIVSMPAVLSLAVSLLGMTPCQAWWAGTRNAAYALGMGGARGALTPGRRADLIVLDTDDPRSVPYRLAHNPVDAVFLGGRLVPPERGRPFERD